jgi:methyl-accepting chemotaxis protein
MNFDDAIVAHTEWKMRLSRYVRKPDGTYTAGEVGRDDKCRLGKWIYGEGRERFGSLPEYSLLLTQHAEFHKKAAEIIQKADSGRTISDEEFTVASDYGRLSTAVINAIRAMRTKTGE